MLNFLLITVDDLNYDSVGVFGCKTKDITPNIDALAREGMRFLYSNVSVAICQPSRQAIMTGLFPHNSGAPGFHPILPHVTTLQELLKNNDYLNGIIGKENHLAPKTKFCWDYYKKTNCVEEGYGRDPAAYYKYTKEFLRYAKGEEKSFFLMANSHDPHRPFAGSLDEFESFNCHLNVTRTINEDEVDIPGFLPDLPDVRKEISEYFTSVHRADEMVGEVLRALKEEGFYDNTVVMFLSDNGMAFPFSKTNCYLPSNRTPWIVRWPNIITPNSFDERHFIRGVDFMPTILEIADINYDGYTDGRSFLPVLKGELQDGREDVYKVINSTAAQNVYPMRGYQDKSFLYIFNEWSSKDVFFVNDSCSGLTLDAMQRAGEYDPNLKQRSEFFLHRCKEELYDMVNDKDALVNLVEEKKYDDRVKYMREKTLKYMVDTGDPMQIAFEKFLKEIQ